MERSGNFYKANTKTSGKIRKKEEPTERKRHHRKREKGKPSTRKYDSFRSDCTCPVGWKQSFFPVCPAVCGRLLHSWGKLTHSASFPLPAQMDS